MEARGDEVMREETKHKIKLAFHACSFFLLLSWIAMGVPARVFWNVVISYAVMTLSFWAFGKAKKIVPAGVLSIIIAVVGTFIQSYSLSFIEHALIFSSILIYVNTGQVVYIIMQQRLKIKMMGLY